MVNTLIFFAEKMWVAFASQRLLTFLQQKYQYIWKYLSYNSENTFATIVNEFVIKKLVKLMIL